MAWVLKDRPKHIGTPQECQLHHSPLYSSNSLSQPLLAQLVEEAHHLVLKVTSLVVASLCPAGIFHLICNLNSKLSMTDNAHKHEDAHTHKQALVSWYVPFFCSSFSSSGWSSSPSKNSSPSFSFLSVSSSLTAAEPTARAALAACSALLANSRISMTWPGLC